MFSIVYISSRLMPEFFELLPDIVNSGSRGRLSRRRPSSLARAT